MPLIALTGGIASGKSTIARRLAEHGAVIVDADAIVREVQSPGSPVLAAIAAEFGSDVIRADGSLDRAALGGRVFGDPDRIARLNAIVHPAVRTESARRFAEALAADPDAVVVYDVPLLVEARADDPWELIVVAHAPADVRARRLVELRGMTAEDAAARIASQVSDEARLEVADVVIDTTGTLGETTRQVDELWRGIAGHTLSRRAR
jgi:dephospho-CoA kinase